MALFFVDVALQCCRVSGDAQQKKRQPPSTSDVVSKLPSHAAVALAISALCTLLLPTAAQLQHKEIVTLAPFKALLMVCIWILP